MFAVKPVANDRTSVNTVIKIDTAASDIASPIRSSTDSVLLVCLTAEIIRNVLSNRTAAKVNGKLK